MLRTFILVFLLLFAVANIAAKVTPAEKSILNYRIVGFSFPAVSGAAGYSVEIAQCACEDEKTFVAQRSVQQKTIKNKTIIELPSFGKQYTWRVVCTAGNKDIKSPFYHFSTGIIPEADTLQTRLHVLKNTNSHKDTYIFVDGARALYDMQGHPVWYLPDIDSLKRGECYPRDMKPTPQGTISLLLPKGIYELDYNGKVLWKMPKNSRKHSDSVDLYHHEFTRLANGNYMVLGEEKYEWKKPASPDSNFVLAADAKPVTGNPAIRTISFGTIVEYNSNKDVVWSWRSALYFRNSDIYFCKTPGAPVDVHENAFYFDEKKKLIYISFKGIDRVLAITYPGGKLREVYGPEYTQSNMAGKTKNNINELFCGQHNCRISREGYLYMFNNNNCRAGRWPTILMLRQTSSGMEKVWEYECDLGDISITYPKPYIFPIGGSAFELPDGSFLASLSGPCSSVLIVNKNKELQWSAVSEKRMGNTNQWMPMISYRASIISRKDLERLIWSAEKK